MVKLSFDNIAQQFEKLGACDASVVAANIGIIENAQRRISVLLDDKKCSARSIASAEYAAAACAFYDYVCTLNAREKLIVTMTGKASANTDYKSRIESAKDLRESALLAIEPVMLGCDFLFRTVEG